MEVWDNVVTMKRRHFLFSPLILACGHIACGHMAAAAEQPWSAQLLKGGFDGKTWRAGLSIKLNDGWKTYWRVPGDGGIAPQLDFSGENLKTTRVDYPLPQRFDDAAGHTIGYKHEVVFPLALEPHDPTRPLNISFKGFFGVCDVVCIPAQVSAEVHFDPALADAPDQLLINSWQKRVPIRKADGPVTKAAAKIQNGKPYLILDLAESVRDIFVEGQSLHYYGQPQLLRGLATVPVSGAKSVDELRNTPLRITIETNSSALEQMVTVV
jgi:DsbC/DsbD-like thiol-disulfide interchange protein